MYILVGLFYMSHLADIAEKNVQEYNAFCFPPAHYNINHSGNLIH